MTNVKTCSHCETVKPLSQFGPDKRRKDGHATKCRLCARDVSKAYYARYPKVEAARRLKGAEATKAWYQRERAKVIVKTRWRRLQRKYGVSQADYTRILAEQMGRCKLCETPKPGRRNKFFAVDHDHSTGAVRGLLCWRCNSGLGFLNDDPHLMRKAAAYVERPGEQPSTLQSVGRRADSSDPCLEPELQSGQCSQVHRARGQERSHKDDRGLEKSALVPHGGHSMARAANVTATDAGAEDRTTKTELTRLARLRADRCIVVTYTATSIANAQSIRARVTEAIHALQGAEYVKAKPSTSWRTAFGKKRITISRVGENSGAHDVVIRADRRGHRWLKRRLPQIKAVLTDREKQRGRP